MLNHSTFWKSALAVGIFCMGHIASALAQGQPDILWMRKVTTDRVNSVIFTPDDNILISGGSDRLIKFWSVADGTLLQTLNTNAPFVHESAIEWMSITPDGKLLATCSYALIQLWELPSGNERRLLGHTDWVVSVAFTKDGSLLASASFDGTAKVWRPDGSLVTTITAPGQQRCVAFSPDGSLLAVASGDDRVRLYRTSDWSLVHTLTGHFNDVFTCSFSPDGQTLASGGYDNTVRIWNVSDGTIKHTIDGNGGTVYSLAFNQDGSQLVFTDGEGHNIKLVRTSDAAVIRTYTEETTDVQTVALSRDGLLGYGRIDSTVILARISGSPSPRITSPMNGTVVPTPANITITASPSKNDGSITRMQFFQNGISLGEDLTAPFSFTWNDVPAGTYALTVRETDNLDVTLTSSVVTISVASQTNTPPSVSITSPAGNTSIPLGTRVNIAASGLASAGIAKVVFYVNQIFIGEDTTPAFTKSWTPTSLGDHELTAFLTDRSGTTVTSSPVVITVTEAPPETVKPTVGIVSPAAGARLTTPDILVKGKAGDNTGVSSVLYSVNGGKFQTATGTEIWEASVTLVPGENIVQVKSLDASGNESPVATRKFIYVVSSPIILQVNGLGVVRKLRDGQILEVGKTYSVSAVPARDQIFDGWTGSVTTNKPTFSFSMESGFSLMANFRPNPFVAVKGIYFGLIQPSTPNHERTGFFRINVTPKGAFSAKITLGGKNHSINGRFNGDGSYSNTSLQTGRTLFLQLDLTNNTDTIVGSLSTESFTDPLVGNRIVFSKLNPSPQAGKYTVLVPRNPEQPDAPQGNGFALLKVDALGKTRLAGTLADGTSFSQGAAVSKGGEWPFYVTIQKGKGSISGPIQFRDQPDISDLDGIVNWFRPADSTAKIFPEGFTKQSTLIGSLYVQPSGSPVLQVSDVEDNVVVNLGSGGLESQLQRSATLESNNHFTVSGSADEKLRLGISTSSGALRGSFIHPVTGRTTSHRGVVFQKQNLAEGFFLGTAQSGFVSVVPAEDEPVSETPVIVVPDPEEPIPAGAPLPEPPPGKNKKDSDDD